jgi:hypothetical protein
LASAFGFGFSGILLSLAGNDSPPDSIVINALLFAFIVGSILVLVATRGKHPGWIGLLVLAALTYLGSATQQVLIKKQGSNLASEIGKVLFSY